MKRKKIRRVILITVLLLLLVVAQRRRIIRQKLEAKELLEQANAQLESKVARRTKAFAISSTRIRGRT